MMDPNQASLPPLAAFIGGVVAQEIVKAMTQKFVPIKQLAIFTFSELIDDITEEPFTDNNSDSYYEGDGDSFVIDEVNSRTEQAMLDNPSMKQAELSSIILFGQALN